LNKIEDITLIISKLVTSR